MTATTSTLQLRRGSWLQLTSIRYCPQSGQDQMYLTNPAYPFLQLLSAMSCTCQSLHLSKGCSLMLVLEIDVLYKRACIACMIITIISPVQLHLTQDRPNSIAQCSYQAQAVGMIVLREGTMSQKYAFWLVVAELTAPPQLALTVTSSSMQCIHQISCRAAGQC